MIYPFNIHNNIDSAESLQLSATAVAESFRVAFGAKHGQKY